jgi:hypothetical protein
MSYYPLTTTGKSLAGAADAAAVRTAAGVGTIATQDSDDVTITGGSLSGVSAVLDEDIQTISSNTTLSAGGVKVVNTASGAVTVTLPAATGSGKRYDIKRGGPNACTIARNGSDTIDNSASNYSVANAECVSLVDSAAGSWLIV